MKAIGYAILALFALGAYAHAQTSYQSQRIGPFTYTNTPQGTYTTQDIGPFSYTNGPNGYSSTTQHIGPFDYTTTNQGYDPSQQ